MKTTNKVYLHRSPEVVLNSLLSFNLNKLVSIEDVTRFKDLILLNDDKIVKEYVNTISKHNEPGITRDIIRCVLSQPELKKYLMND